VTEFLATVHPWLGYLACVVVLVASLAAFRRAKDAREFVPGPISGALVLLDLTVVVGVLLYVAARGWQAERVGVAVAYLHPALAVLAVVVGRFSLRRARRLRMAVDAHRTAGRGLAAALVLMLASIAAVVAGTALIG
jgi:hypothetical protein